MTPKLPGYVFVVPWDLSHTGGVNQVVINLHREMLSAAEFEPLVLVNDWSAFRPTRKVVEGRDTIHMRLWSPWPSPRPILGLLKWILASPFWIFDLLRLCRAHRVAAFNIHFPNLGAFQISALRFLHLYRGALIISFHGADLREARKASFVERALWKFLLRSSSAIIACSSAFAADVNDFAGAPAGKIRAIQNGLDVRHFLSSVDGAASLPAALAGRDFILSVATWEWKKGLDTLLKAFVQVRRSRAGLALALVGRAGGADPELRALARELEIENDVFFFEDVPHAQVGLFLKRASAFCLPSRVEPFGIAILEAGAYRLPVAASRAGGIPEIILDGESGLLFEPDDVKGLTAALDRLLSNVNFARGLGERLYERVVGSFTWRRAYEEYRALLR